MANNDSLFVDPVLLQQAEGLCKLRLKNDSENRVVLRSLAEVYRKQGILGEAAAIYERLFHLDPQDQEAAYMHALLGAQDWPAIPKGIRAAPFVVLRDFLPHEFHAALLPFAVAVHDKFVPATAYSDQQGTVKYNPNFRQSLDFSADWEGTSRFNDCLVNVLPRVATLLGIDPFKIHYVETQLRAHRDGNFLKLHMDAPPGSTRANRVVSFAYYFHRLPRPYTGGDLLLFDSDIESNTFTRSRFTRVVPEDNSVVIFPSNFYHCVVPVQCPSNDFADSRFSVGGFVRKCVPKLPIACSVDNRDGVGTTQTQG